MSFHSRHRGGLRSPLVATAAAALAAVTVATAPQAQATLSGIGPVDQVTGYPSYYTDASGRSVVYCITDPLCVGGDTRPDSSQLASVATGNLPDEAFYAFAEAEVNLNGGGRLRWRAVLEGAWLSEEVIDGDQMTFTRIQFSGSKIPLSRYPAGTVLTATTPYGNISASVRSDGTLSRARKESAPGTVDNGFMRPVTETATGYGPTFLRWNTGAPAGYLGDPEVDHAVTGAKPGQANAVRIYRGTTISDATAVSPAVTQFAVGGKYA
jgi:hypothetical protein